MFFGEGFLIIAANWAFLDLHFHGFLRFYFCLMGIG